MSNIERLSESEIAAAFTGEPDTGVPFEMVVQIARAIESAVHAKLSAPVEVGEAPVAWLVDWPDEPELGSYFAESPVPPDHGRCVSLYPSSLVEQQAREIAELWCKISDREDAITAMRQTRDEMQRNLIRQGEELSKLREALKRAAEALEKAEQVYAHFQMWPMLDELRASLAELRSVKGV